MTRTALIMNGLAAFRFSSMRQSAKALFKPKEQNQQLIYQLNFKKKLDFFLKKMIKYNYRKESTKNETQIRTKKLER